MRKKIIIILSIVVVALVVIFSFIFVKTRKPAPVPTGLPTTGAGYKSLVPGVSTKEDALHLLGTPLSTSTSDKLDFKSNNPNLPTQVVTSNDKVALIREIVTVGDKKTATDIISQYGTAPDVLYGPDSINGFNLYVYPDKGIAYLGHVKEPIVLEIWYFQPTTLDNFKNQWASGYSDSFQPSQ